MAGPLSFSMGCQAQPFIIDDEDEDVPQHPLSAETRQVADIWRRAREVPAIHDLTRDENDVALDEEATRRMAEAEAEYEREFDMVDLTQDVESAPSVQRRNAKPSQCTPLAATHSSQKAYRIHGARYKVGDCIELKEAIGEWTIQFVEIKSIWVSKSTGEVTFHGLPYSRARYLFGRLECKLNEVCQILERDFNDDRPDQAHVQVKAEQILCLRSLYKTNAVYPKFKLGGDGSWSSKAKEDTLTLGPLTCRWTMRALYKNRRPWRYDAALVHFTEEDIEDSKFRVSDRESRKDWLGTDEIRPNSAGGRKYTFGDLYSGCGGVTRGAVMAGLKPTVSVDHWDIAVQSFKRNFPGVRTYNEDMFHFCTERARSQRRVDILHLSPPCQFFSPCHTREGKDDDMNNAALFACAECVKRIRPRLVTLEQTFGLVDRHSGYFNALVHGFTSLGYSIQWRVVPLVEYGLPQTRRRLIIIASCPGEKLPPWPAPTHGPPGSGLKPFVTEAAAFRPLRRNTDLHDVRAARRVTETPRSGNAPFSGTITCSGPTTVKHHHDGTRVFTLRELACLQGFPLQHVFEGNRSATMKQIGNAFAPCVVKVFLGHLRRCLERRDAASARLPAPAAVPAAVPETPRRVRASSPQRVPSAASSVTMDFSPSPDPSSGLESGPGSGSSASSSKRKFKDVDDRPAKLESLMKRIRQMEVSQHGHHPVLLDKSPNAGSSGSSGKGEASPVATTPRVPISLVSPSPGPGPGPGPSHRQRDDRTPYPPQSDQAMSFPRKLWKLPTMRATSADWRF